MPDAKAPLGLNRLAQPILLLLAGLVVAWASHDGAPERGLAQDLVTGVANAILVSSLAFGAAVGLGSLVSAALRSRTLQVYRAGAGFVAWSRKIPLALQLLLWFGLLSLAPAPGRPLSLGGAVFLSNRDLYLPQLVWNARGAAALAAITAAALLGAAFTLWAQQRVRHARPGPMPAWGMIIFLCGAMMTLLVSRNPSGLDLPHGQGLGLDGGLAVATPFVALWATLSVSGAGAMGAVFAQAERSFDATPARADPLFRAVVGQYLSLLAGACVTLVVGWPAAKPWSAGTLVGLSLAVVACLGLDFAVGAIKGAWDVKSGELLEGRRRNPERA